MPKRNQTPKAPSPQSNPGRHASRPPSPPERHPGKKPEDAGGRYDDLKIRDRGNAR